MKPDKSPGSDGLTPAFYLKYFTILSGDMNSFNKIEAAFFSRYMCRWMQ